MTLPDPTSIEQTRSRRAILAGALGGLAGLVGGRLARPDPTVAAAGGPVIMGVANSAGITNTSLVTASTGTALQVTQSGSGTALRGSAVGVGSIAGFFTANNGTGISGVTGHRNSFGVFAQNNGAAGSGAAVRARGDNNHGLVATTSSGTASAVRAVNTHLEGLAVEAQGFTGVRATGGDTGVLAIGEAFGVLGSATGAGVYGQAEVGVYGNGGGVDGVGVQGESSGQHGVFGRSTAVNGYGVRGLADDGLGSVGVFGESADNEGGHFVGGFAGLFAAGDDTAVFAQGGLVGVDASGTSTGVTASGAGAGIHATSADTAGIFESTGDTGVAGTSSSGGIASAGGRFTCTASGGIGVVGTANTGGGAYGVLGVSSSGTAGRFEGNVVITGSLDKASGSFLIDHPLDPANKTLRHSFVESPDMMNVYNGNVTTDAKGEATVKLPAYFGALNRDFRYQLTTIGARAQTWVSAKMANNAFSIKTDQPDIEVSWQVTGIRQDAYAKAHPMIVEADKTGAERGKYLNPKEHGKPASAGVNAERLAKLDQKPAVHRRAILPRNPVAKHPLPARISAPEAASKAPGRETP